jgi:RNA recognition motif-containing protein
MRLDRADLDNSTGTLVFVGNLPWSASNSDLATLFASYSPMDVHVKTTVRVCLSSDHIIA